MNRFIALFGVIALLLCTTSAAAQSEADPAKDLFVAKCASCHTVGDGARVGPDLKGVADRRDAAWVMMMIQSPSKLLDSDADARKLLTEFKNVRMPDLGLSNEQVQTLLDLLIKCSKEKCDLKGKFIPVDKATADDVQRGVGYFTGTIPFKSGAPACISCHTIEGLSGILGGGNLSKDLTHSFATLGDEGLDAALRNPTFPLMNKVFSDKPLDADETFALRATMYEANKGGLGGKESQPISVILVALVAAALALAALNALWSRPKREGIHRAVLAKAVVVKKESQS